MKTIVCAVDFSTHSLSTAVYAAAFAHALDADLILIHSFRLPLTYSEIAPPLSDAEEMQLVLAAEKKLNGMAARLNKHYPELAIRKMLVHGEPSVQVVKAAEEADADLIISGSTDSTFLRRLLLGNTTGHLIREAHCPVLCVPKNAKFHGIRKIVFATDLRKDNLKAASALIALAKKTSAEIIFLYVDHIHLLHSEEDITKYINSIRSKVSYPKISGYICKDTNTVRGISFFLQKNPADLLVLFTHLRHFPGTLFHHGITGILSHQTKIPLLSLKAGDSVPV